jgi:hypothetical protein
MISVTLTGFKNIEAAKQFVNWFEGQGEQDIQIWWEYRQDDGLDIGKSPMIDNRTDYVITDNSIIAKVKND